MVRKRIINPEYLGLPKVGKFEISNPEQQVVWGWDFAPPLPPQVGRERCTE